MPEERAPREEIKGTFQMPEGYKVSREEPSKKTRVPEPPAQPSNTEGYQVSREAPPAAPPAPVMPPGFHLFGIFDRELSESELPLPQWPLLQGVFTFPWYPSMLGTWVILNGIFLGWAYLYVLMQELNPMR